MPGCRPGAGRYGRVVSSYRFLLSRRWLILTLVAVALIPTMIELGFWQYHRHQHRVAGNELIARSLAADPVPVGRLTRSGVQVPEERMWRRVTATGRYDTGHEVVARQRTASDGAQIGYFVITPLVLDDGRAVLVNRGWIAPGDDITVFPDVPPAPKGEVTVTGRLRPDETTATSGIKDKPGMPDRQIMLIDSERLSEAAGRPLLGGYLELTATSPAPPGTQPERVPAPDHESIGAHMAYAVQWWLFTALVPVGWVILARRERRDLLAEKAKGAAPGRPGGSGPASAPGRPGGPRPASGPAGAGPDRPASDPSGSAPGPAPAGVPTTADATAATTGDPARAEAPSEAQTGVRADAAAGAVARPAAHRE